jgi:DNA-binding CsgD family transcriptional regulator
MAFRRGAASSRALDRARADLDVASRAGLPLHPFLSEAASTLETAVPFVAGCLSTLDPATAMVSGTLKVEALAGYNDADLTWARIEYGADDPTALRSMVREGRTSLGVHRETHGEVERSVWMAELMIPQFGFRDEARVVFTDHGGAWGSMSLFRGSDDDVFSGAELEFLASLAPLFTRGIRTGLIAQLGAGTPVAAIGPAVIIVDAGDRIVSHSPDAEALYARMTTISGGTDPLIIVQALVTSARRTAGGQPARLSRLRVRTADGAWLVLQAAPLVGDEQRRGDVVVSIEEARPQEVLELVAGAFGLTAREREVVALVVRGDDTRRIAAALHLSPYTVQDHLKSIFAKAGVASRRELVAKIYLDQYVPRQGERVSPDGWYAGPR